MEKYYSSFIYLLLLLTFLLYIAEGERVDSLEVVATKRSSCDLFDGTWVFDDTFPLYNSSACPFFEKQFDCLRNHRPNQLYLKYRWKPNGCELPRFDGLDFMMRYSGKKIMFVGDSLSLNQWQSLTCMLHTSDPQAKYTLTQINGLSTFTILKYNIKVMLNRNAFLIDIVGESRGRVLKLDSIDNGKEWLGADMLIFNTWHWWLHTGRKQPWDLIVEGNTTYKDMNRLIAYEKALTTWRKWVDKNVDLTKTSIFFQGVSPDHSNGIDWGEPKANNCLGRSVPFDKSTYPAGQHPAETILKKVLNQLTKPVYLLDVTKLSQLRIDGHPSAYGFSSKKFPDCSHWCLAGVPDTWNQLLYASL
ncbi:hypothetical protein Sjap_026207 [Stephania japonica]|uniref:Trichome birefringence-like N-terminal domain-containing protein n=1 Tax=Stephania japonica TaxID=461633 RepID=A0AAP0E360_9MAGN